MKTPILACLTASLCATAYATPADDLANAVRPLAAAPNCTWIITPDPKLARPVQTEWRGNREGWQIGRVLDRNELSSVSDGRRRFNRLPGKPWVLAAVVCLNRAPNLHDPG